MPLQVGTSELVRCFLQGLFLQKFKSFKGVKGKADVQGLSKARGDGKNLDSFSRTIEGA
jgi:hypothetical protein